MTFSKPWDIWKGDSALLGQVTPLGPRSATLDPCLKLPALRALSLN